MFLSSAPADVVHFLYDTRVDVTVVLSCGFSADVCRSGDDGFLETVAQLAGEGFLRDAYANGAVGSDEVRSQVYSPVKDECSRSLTFGL